MKKLLLLFGAAALLFQACQKGDSYSSSWQENENALATGREISFLPISQQTRAGMVETTSVKNFNVYAWKSDGSEYFGVHTTYTNGIYENVSQCYWPLDERLNFFAYYPRTEFDEQVIKVDDSGRYIAPWNLNGTQDLMVSSAQSTPVPAASSPYVSLNFTHILSNFASLTLQGSQSNASYRINSVSMTLSKYDKYYFERNAWHNSLYNPYTATFALPQAFNGTSSSSAVQNYSLVPGEHSMTINYTVTVNGESRTYEKTGVVDFPQGQKTTVTGVLTQDYEEVRFTTSVQDWTEGFVDITL